MVAVELGGLAGVVSFRADEVGSVTGGLRVEAALRPRAWTSLLHFSAFWMGTPPPVKAYMSNGFTINNHQTRLKNIKKRKGFTRDDVGQGVIERCLGGVAISSKGCVLLE